MNYTLNAKRYTLTIGWLYPDLMSTYGDRGNIIILQKRCEWRGIKCKVIPIIPGTLNSEFSTLNLLFGGGSQDREQEIVMRDLKGKKQIAIKNFIESGKPALFVCGSPQLMGKYYEPAVGQRIEGLGIFDIVTKNPGPNAPRLIGNIVAKVNWDNFQTNVIASEAKQSTIDNRSRLNRDHNDNLIVGFENHGGRTYLGKNVKPFAKVIRGFGNNGNDSTEGVIYKNAIGCYFHGPLLPKNPQIADFLIQKALQIKYKQEITLKPLDDSLELKAKQTMLERLGINY
jgi:lipid II isoglutaminyl synthase (glutamine-hydrolysing)